MDSTNKSEVARLCQQLEQECEAMQRGLYGLASVAAHEIIRHRYQALGDYAEELAKHVGQEQAVEIMAVTYSEKVG
ncbi:MAG: hypothetical protein JO202_00995 [Ktedonobacteraceae bacterium]|nr:hypothetical protein [Ktedonobacteraceae bacterium]